MSVPLVNLFIAGWPKTGTTSLYHYLEQHPDILAASKKDTYFFCDDIRESSIRFHGGPRVNFVSTRQHFDSLFAHRQSEQVVCESSVFCAVSQTAAKNMAAYNPQSKVILILREPRELIRSWYNYQKLHSREVAKTFEEAMLLEDQRKADHSLIPRCTYCPIQMFYRELVKFDEGIRRFLHHFPDDRVRILLSDDLRNDTSNTVRGIYEFLNVDPEYTPELSEKNVTVAGKNLTAKRFVDTKLLPIKRMVRRSLTGNSHGRLKSVYSWLFTGNQSADKSLADDTDEHLKEEFRPMLERTSEILQTDLLAKWGYR